MNPTYTVEFTGASAKELRKLDPPLRRRILDVIAGLEQEPRPAGAVKLAGFNDAWRIRVNEYRVLYEVLDDAVLVTVCRVGHRRDVYGKL